MPFSPHWSSRCAAVGQEASRCCLVQVWRLVMSLTLRSRDRIVAFPQGEVRRDMNSTF